MSRLSQTRDAARGLLLLPALLAGLSCADQRSEKEEKAEEPTLVKCGLFIGGNYAAIYEGTYPSADTAKLSMPLEPGKTYDVEVCVDLDRNIAEMVIEGHRLEKKLTTHMEAIRHFGYSVVWTRTEFGAVSIPDRGRICKQWNG